MWNTVFPKARSSGNALTYNSCCNTFTKRGSTNNSGHPPDLQISLSDLMVKEDIKDQKILMGLLIEKAKKAKEAGVSFPFLSISKTHLTKQEAVLMVVRLKSYSEELSNRLEVEHNVNILVEENSHQLLFLSKALEEKVKELQKERDEAK